MINELSEELGFPPLSRSHREFGIENEPTPDWVRRKNMWAEYVFQEAGGKWNKQRELTQQRREKTVVLFISSQCVSVCVWFYYAPNYCACCFRTHNVCYSFQLIWNRGRTRLRKSFDGIWSSIFYEQQQQQQQSWQSINQQQRVLIVLGHNKWYLLQLSVANSWFARHGPTYIHSFLLNSFFWPPHSFHQDKQIQFCKAFWAAVNSGFFQSKCTN